MKPARGRFLRTGAIEYVDVCVCVCVEMRGSAQVYRSTVSDERLVCVRVHVMLQAQRVRQKRPSPGVPGPNGRGMRNLSLAGARTRVRFYNIRSIGYNKGLGDSCSS